MDELNDSAGQALLRSKAEGIAEVQTGSTYVRHPAIPLSVTSEELFADVAPSFSMIWPYLAVWPVLTVLLHESPIAQPTKPDDATGVMLWVMCAMLVIPVLALLNVMVMESASFGPGKSLRKRFAVDSILIRLPGDAARHVNLFRAEKDALLSLDPTVELVCLANDAEEQVRLWQLDLLAAHEAGRTSEAARVEEALRTAAIDMTYLRLAQQQAREQEREAYEEALGEAPVNLAAAARSLELEAGVLASDNILATQDSAHKTEQV